MSALADRLGIVRERNERVLTAEMREKMVRHIEALRAAGAVLRALKAGSPAPEFTLRDQQARSVSSQALLAEGPLIVSFDRGTWCEYCCADLAALVQAYPRIRAAGAELVVLTPQSATSAAPYFAVHEPPFPVLVDPDAKVGEAYGLDYDVPPYLIQVYRGLDTDLARINAGSSWRLPTPARFVIDRSGTIVDARLNPDHRFRFDPAESIAALERLHIGARA